jgi:hypothetical protein
MRLTLWAALALAVCACSDSTSSSSGGITATDAADISVAESDEVEQSLSAMSAPASLAAEAPTAPGCTTVDDETDTDGDLQPDNATYTFALPACHFTGFRGGSLDVTGTINLRDLTLSAPGLAVVATLHDFTFAFTSPDQARTYSAVRNGTRTLTGNAQSASLSNQVTVVRSRPSRADATVVHNLLLTFTPSQGESLAFGQPLPDGTFERTGTFTWSRGGRSLTFTVTTVAPIVWDASCTTDRKISSGETHATLEDGSYVKTVWTACGVDPTRTYVPAG